MKKTFAFLFFLTAGFGLAIFCLLYLNSPYDAYFGYPVGFFTLFFLFLPKKTHMEKKFSRKKTQK